MNFHCDEEFLSRLNLFTGDTMKNPWMQSSISITMIITHNDYEVLSWLIIFIATNDFHQKWIFFTLMNFNHNVFFFHYHGRFSSQWWTFFHYANSSSQWKIFITEKQFYHNVDTLSPWWMFITMINFHHNVAFS